jgi:hypothetical protein
MKGILVARGIYAVQGNLRNENSFSKYQLACCKARIMKF